MTTHTRTLDDPPRDLLPGFGVHVVRTVRMGADEIAETRTGLHVPLRDLRQPHAAAFSGVHLRDGWIDLAFVMADDAPVRSAALPDAPIVGRKSRLDRVTLRRRDGPKGFYETTAGWMAGADLRVPVPAPRPPEAGPDEIWIDVSLETQTLIVARGDRPQFVTLVSTGVGAQGTAFATPLGTHRIGAKLMVATMDNLEHTDVVPYFYESVPYTQYIGRVALHGVFWHGDFGRPRSHGCINLSMSDARYVFGLTRPYLAAHAESARGPNGTLVRVR